jgi:hypothetical protein
VLRVEVLEGRLAPAVLTVNTWVDETTADSYLSLREAINAVNASSESGLSSAEQAQIVGTLGSNDTIQFDPSLTGQTITLASGELLISQNLAINGPGAASLTISGGQASRVFEVGSSTTLAISGLSIANGHVGDHGGGILNGGTATLINITVIGNSIDFQGGGGIFNVGTLTVIDSTIAGNSADSEGGGIGNSGTATLINTAVTGNSASFYGGGIFNGGTLSVIDSNLGGNAADPGGGIYNILGALTVTDSTLAGNDGGLNGGGIFNEGGTVTVTGCTLSGNAVGEIGGGITNEGNGTLAVIDSTVTGNFADRGGGIGNDSGTMTVIDSTLTGNTAGDFGGGGILNLGTLTVTNSTIVDNSAPFPGVFNTGGGIENSGTLTVGNTIIAGNTAFSSGPDVAGAVSSQGYNLVGDASGSSGFGAAGDQVGTDPSPVNPLLGPLQDNGGPTQTRAPLPGSPAIDAGSNALAVDASGNPLTTDQRGFPRIVNVTVDIGAVEVQGPTVTALASSANLSWFGRPVTFTATVSPSASGATTPRGQVTFQDGATVLTTVPLDGSGRASFTTSVLAAGPHTITATYTGIDTFGGSSARRTETVAFYIFSGFLGPLSRNRTFVRGRTIPVIFGLTDINGNLVTSLSAVVSLQAAPVNPDGSLGAPFALKAPGSTAMRNDGSQYVFNWQTKGLAPGPYAILVTLADGTVHSTIIELTANHPSAGLTTDAAGDTGSATGGLVGDDVEPYAVAITQITDPALANVTVYMDTTSAVGGYADGVLGYTADSGQLTLIQGWDFFASSDLTQISSGQHDFQTVATHELGHTLYFAEYDWSPHSESLLAGSVLALGLAAHPAIVGDLMNIGAAQWFASKRERRRTLHVL